MKLAYWMTSDRGKASLAASEPHRRLREADPFDPPVHLVAERVQ
jgi:hypothetical protein